MRLPRPKRAAAVIPTASMAGIAFLLSLFFFMLTAAREVDRTGVSLPVATIREQAEKGAAVVVLARDPFGVLTYGFSDGRSASRVAAGPADIFHEASAITYEDPARQFVVKADASVRFEAIDELLDTLRRAGVRHIVLQCAQHTAGQSG